MVMGLDYFAMKMVDTEKGVVLQAVNCKDALEGSAEQILCTIPLKSEAVTIPYSDKYMSTTVPPVAPLSYTETTVYLKIKVRTRERKGNVPDAVCSFAYSLDGLKWKALPEGLVARPGKWIGAKFGLFCNRYVAKNDSGMLKVDWVRVGK